MIWIPGKVPPPGSLLTDAKKTGFVCIATPPSPPINWAEWVSLPSVQLWQAIALSCGIMPSSSLDASAATEGREYDRRLKVALNHIGKGGALVVVEANARAHLTRICLQDVSKLARICSWALPNEFPQISTPSIELSTVSKTNTHSTREIPSDVLLGVSQYFSPNTPLKSLAQADKQEIVRTYARMHSTLGRKPHYPDIFVELRRGIQSGNCFEDYLPAQGLLWVTTKATPSFLNERALGDWLTRWLTNEPAEPAK